MEEEVTRICRVCGEEKPLDEFRIRGDSGKRRTECKGCLSKYLKKYRSENKQHIAELNKKWVEAHREELAEYQLNWQRNNREKCHAYNKKSSQNMTEEQKARRRVLEKRRREILKLDSGYVEKRRVWNRESTKRRRKRITAYEMERKKNDPVFKLKKQIRGEIRMSFNRRGFRKSERTEAIVGCTLQELYDHLCKTYLIRYGEKYNGNRVVHIDHIIPLANARTEEEVKKLCRWDNLQLLTAEDNLMKNADGSFPSYRDLRQSLN